MLEMLQVKLNINYGEIIGNVDASTEIPNFSDYCSPVYHNTIKYLLTILAIIPVITATNERTFLATKIIKSLPGSVIVD